MPAVDPDDKLVTAYYAVVPNASVVEQKITFGAFVRRGSSFIHSFNEWHVLAITQAIFQYRKQHGIGPLFFGMDTHAFLKPA